MEVLIGAAVVIAFLFFARQSGLLSSIGLPGTALPTAGTGTPGTAGAGTATGQTNAGQIMQDVTTAQQGSNNFASLLQQYSQQGESATFQGLTTIGTSATSLGLGIAGVAGLGAGAAVTGGIGVVVGIAAMLWAQHEQRMKDATDENSAWNVIYPDWSDAMQQILSAYNTGQITASNCAAEFESLKALVYQDAQKFKNQPGISWNSTVGLSNSQKIWQVQCTKQCTIGCCLFNGMVGPNIERAVALVTGQPVMVFGSGTPQNIQTNSFTVPSVSPNSTYGFNGAPSFVMAVNPPAGSNSATGSPSTGGYPLGSTGV